MKKILLLMLCLIGCGLLKNNDYQTPEEKMAVLRVCNDYLRFIASSNHPLAEGLIGWSDYGPAKDGSINRLTFAEKLVENKDKWKESEHPLLGLDVKEVDVTEDDAEVVLQKKGGDSIVQIELRWAGRGWLIVNDNIFSKNGIYH